MLKKMSNYINDKVKFNMSIEQELKPNPLHKEFQNLLDKDFKDKNLKKTK